MRGLRFVIWLAFGLSVALAGCESLSITPTAHPDPTVDPAVVSALAPACDGQAVSGAGVTDTSGTVANHLVLLSDTGAPFELSDWLPDTWAPTSIADAELVACVPVEPQRNVIQVCPYTGADITRYEVSRDFKVVEAATGSTIAEFTITARPRICHSTESASVTELEGVIEAEVVVAHLAGLVERGSFIDPDAPDASIEPGKTSEPGQTTEPSRTAKPTGSAEAVELRDALTAGQVSMTGTGDGLQSLDVELTSEVDVDLDVTIEAGTLLEPRARGTQLMVVVAEQTVSLAANETLTVSLDVACAEMHQEQPTGDDTFRVLEDQPENDLLLLLGTPDFADATGRVTQFAVWTITNNPKRNGYVGLTSGFEIFGSGPDDEEIAAIRDLFDAAGIDIDKYRALR